jgi:uncharacterized membrane protein YcaP (DUF421 family)
MSSEKIRVFDLARMVLGNTPATFLIEAALRLSVLYAVLALAMRLMGRRMSSQLSRNELLAMVALAAGIGPAMQDPQRGLLPAFVVAAWVVLFQWAVAKAMASNDRFEAIANGIGDTLVIDGRVLVRALRRNVVSRERLFAELRGHGITQLGEVERVYIEANGSFSIVRFDEPRPGLTVIPTFDRELLAEQRRETETACATCGALTGNEEICCRFCRSQQRMQAVVSAE